MTQNLPNESHTYGERDVMIQELSVEHEHGREPGVVGEALGR